MESHFLIYREIIPDFDDFLESLDQPHPSHLRVNRLKTTSDVVIERLGRYKARLSPLPVENGFAFEGLEKPGATLEYFLGFYHLQGLSSMLPPLILDVEGEHSVLDMCASPGSKTTQISAIMGNRGLLIANELNRRRLSILKFHIERLGATNVVVTSYQAQNFPTKYPDRTPLRFDRVLLDAPCTGEGRYRTVLRSDEAEKMRPFSEKGSQIMSRYQKQMILRGFDLLKDGGIMVYSTCTYSPCENEMVVDFLLKEREGAEVVPFKLKGLKIEQGVTAWKGMVFDPSLSNTGRVYPHRIDSWGFFMAKIRKLSLNARKPPEI